MPTIRLYRNGVSAFMGGTGNHERAPRGEIVGWSPATARRQVRWLWAVDVEGLTGHGYAVTLTIRDLPPDAAAFHRLRRAWLKRVERMGAIRVHWVIEWQRRGVPHIHAAVYFRDPLPVPAALAWQWVAIAPDARPQSQHVDVITGTMGWLKYLAKHAARGASHYQRQGHPEGWTKTGRMWGHTGSWPVSEAVDAELSSPEFYRLRRILRRWATSRAAAAGDWRTLAKLRRSPGRIAPSKSRYVGASEWIGESEMMLLLDFLERSG